MAGKFRVGLTSDHAGSSGPFNPADIGLDVLAGHPEIEWENPFRRELTHFHRCITGDGRCRTPVVDARQDVALIIDIVQRYLAAGGLRRGRSAKGGTRCVCTSVQCYSPFVSHFMP